MYRFILLVLLVPTANSDSHSLRYYYTGVSAPGFGLPEFSIVGYVDDREIELYSTDIGRNIPVVRWMKEKKDAEYWETETETAKKSELFFKHDVRTAMSRFNQTQGFHIYQVMYGCELGDDDSITGYEQHGYDGREFIVLDTKTWTFIPSMQQAVITTQKINSPDRQAGQITKEYIEKECIDALKEYIEYGRDDLDRRVQPKVKVSAEDHGETTMLHCQVYGFHPKRVDVKWKKNGQDDVTGYQTTHTLPNPDGTYQIRVSAEVMPREGDSYSCYVDHSSLEEPLSVVWEPKPEELSGLVTPVVIAVVAVIILLAVGIGGCFLYKKKKDGYKTTSTSDASSNSSHDPKV